MEGEANFSLSLGHEAHPKTTLYGVVFQKIEWAPLTGQQPRIQVSWPARRPWRFSIKPWPMKQSWAEHKRKEREKAFESLISLPSEQQQTRLGDWQNDSTRTLPSSANWKLLLQMRSMLVVVGPSRHVGLRFTSRALHMSQASSHDKALRSVSRALASGEEPIHLAGLGVIASPRGNRCATNRI